MSRWISGAARELALGITRGVLLVVTLLAGSASADDTHWAFQRGARPVVPRVERAAAALNPIDRFIVARLEREGLALNSREEPATLLRRLALSLTGLPPEPADVDAFLADPSAAAYERQIDRYLASSAYGERWGKYWLDAAGYADSNGYFSADTDRPLAWRYRDYVIAAHNADKPFDEFIREQLAGDELSGYAPGQPVSPAMRDALIATHFLRNAPDGTGESDGNPDEVRVDRYTVLEGTAQILGSSLFGLTLQCAKCHDHKFEPVTQREYYQLQSFLFPAYDVDHWVKPNERVVEVDGEKISWLSDLRAEAPEVHLLVRGDPKHPGETVVPEVPSFLHDERAPFQVATSGNGRTTGRRAALARWLTATESRSAALLSRITVNRLWQHYFATGLVATPENLGVTGAAPSHPELLEYLASELRTSGWSIKHLQRLIVQSAVFQQSSESSEAAVQRDPNNRWLARFPLHRLDSDAVRDGLLAACGQLDRRVGGPFVPTKRSGVGAVYVEESNPGYFRRSVYLQQRRTQVESLLATFDAPSIVASCPKRPSTTTPLQSLEQLNGEFPRSRARALAALLLGETHADDRDQSHERMTRAFLRTCGRPPSPEERAACTTFVKEQTAEYSGKPEPERDAWIDLCQTLLAGNAFLYVE